MVQKRHCSLFISFIYAFLFSCTNSFSKHFFNTFVISGLIVGFDDSKICKTLSLPARSLQDPNDYSVMNGCLVCSENTGWRTLSFFPADRASYFPASCAMAYGHVTWFSQWSVDKSHAVRSQAQALRDGCAPSSLSLSWNGTEWFSFGHRWGWCPWVWRIMEQWLDNLEKIESQPTSLAPLSEQMEENCPQTWHTRFGTVTEGEKNNYNFKTTLWWGLFIYFYYEKY